MHFWIDKRSPYGRGARVSGSGFGQYPRRIRPSKPWSQTNRNVTTPNTDPTHGDTLIHHQHHHHHVAGSDPLDATSSPSYFKWGLWAIAISLSTTLVYIICAKLVHEHQLFTLCALLAIFFILGVCTVSSIFRRTDQPVATAAAAPQESSSARAAGSTLDNSTVPDNSSPPPPSISIRPSPTHHNQV